MLIPYLKNWVFTPQSGSLVFPNTPLSRIDPVQTQIIRRISEGGYNVDDLGSVFGGAWKNNPQTVRRLVLDFLGRLERVIGVSELTLPSRVDAVIIDRGWGGVFQHAVDLWQTLNKTHRVLLIVPYDPPYGFDRDLGGLLVTPPRLGLDDSSLSCTVSLARTVIKKLPFSLLLFTHRIMTPYFFDCVTRQPTIIYGDSHSEACLRIGQCMAPDPPEHNIADVLQELYFGPPEAWKSLIHAKALYWTFKQAAENWFWCGDQFDTVKADFPEFAERLRVVLPPIDTEHMSPSAEGASSERWVLFTTTSEKSKVGAKGLTPLLRVLDRLSAVKLRVVLHDRRCIPDEATGLGDRVQILAGVPKTGMLSIYRDSLVNCRISRADSSPVSILESMACGVPVIVSPVIAQNIPIIVDGVTGFVVDPDDVDCLERRLALLLENHELRKRMGAAARQAILQHSLLNNLHLITRYFGAAS